MHPRNGRVKVEAVAVERALLRLVLRQPPVPLLPLALRQPPVLHRPSVRRPPRVPPGQPCDRPLLSARA